MEQVTRTRFRGTAVRSVEQRSGRTTVPAVFREVLVARYGPELVLVPFAGPCIIACPAALWEQVGSRFDVHLGADPGVESARLPLAGTVTQRVLDAAGRVRLPVALREMAGITDTCVWVGLADHLRLWEPATLATAVRAEAGVLPANLCQALERLDSER